MCNTKKLPLEFWKFLILCFLLFSFFILISPLLDYNFFKDRNHISYYTSLFLYPVIPSTLLNTVDIQSCLLQRNEKCYGILLGDWGYVLCKFHVSLHIHLKIFILYIVCTHNYFSLSLSLEVVNQIIFGLNILALTPTCITLGMSLILLEPCFFQLHKDNIPLENEIR